MCAVSTCHICHYCHRRRVHFRLRCLTPQSSQIGPLQAQRVLQDVQPLREPFYVRLTSHKMNYNYPAFTLRSTPRSFTHHHSAVKGLGIETAPQASRQVLVYPVRSLYSIAVLKSTSRITLLKSECLASVQYHTVVM